MSRKVLRNFLSGDKTSLTEFLVAMSRKVLRNKKYGVSENVEGTGF